MAYVSLPMASPNPGVSTTVNLNLTPRSSISTVEASSWTVFLIFSAAFATIRSIFCEKNVLFKKYLKKGLNNLLKSYLDTGQSRTKN